jgi:hypothetical protein
MISVPYRRCLSCDYSSHGLYASDESILQFTPPPGAHRIVEQPECRRAGSSDEWQRLAQASSVAESRVETRSSADAGNSRRSRKTAKSRCVVRMRSRLSDAPMLKPWRCQNGPSVIVVGFGQWSVDSPSRDPRALP